MSKVKFVYFDLGGVVILDFTGTNKWKELKNELGFFGEREKDFDAVWYEHEQDIVLGKMEVDDLLPIYVKRFGTVVSGKYSLLVNGFADRFEKNEKIFSLIEKIKETSKIGLLTNAYKGMLDAVKKRGILPDVNWDNIVDSSVIASRKPDSEIYHLAEDLAGVKGGEILFVDNTLKNLDAAKKYKGWRTFYYDSSNITESNKRLSEFWNNLSSYK